MPSVLKVTPDQAGYSVTDGEEVLAVKLDGGLSRYRRDVVGAASTVRVQWSVGPTEYTYLRAFYRTTTSQGTESFLVDLILDSATLTQHTAYFVPGSMRLTRVRGNTYTVQAQMEVKPLAPDSEYDEALVMIYEEYGSLRGEFLSDIKAFVNDYLPSSGLGS